MDLQFIAGFIIIIIFFLLQSCGTTDLYSFVHLADFKHIWNMFQNFR